MKKKNLYNPHAWIVGKPTIGENTWIGAFTLIDAKHAALTIGKGCNISTGAQIITHSTVNRCISEGKYTTIDSADTVIEDFCFIGSNAVVMMGCHIGHHSVIGAGCVVTENTTIPPYSIVTGVPGKVVGSAKKYTVPLSSPRRRGSKTDSRSPARQASPGDAGGSRE